MQSDQAGKDSEAGKVITGALPDILAIIESAKARGGVEALRKFIAKTLPESEDLAFGVRPAMSAKRQRSSSKSGVNGPCSLSKVTK